MPQIMPQCMAGWSSIRFICLAIVLNASMSGPIPGASAMDSKIGISLCILCFLKLLKLMWSNHVSDIEVNTLQYTRFDIFHCLRRKIETLHLKSILTVMFFPQTIAKCFIIFQLPGSVTKSPGATSEAHSPSRTWLGQFMWRGP